MSHLSYPSHWRGHLPSLCTSCGDCRSPRVPVALFLHLLCSVAAWLPAAGKSPGAVPTSWVKPKVKIETRTQRVGELGFPHCRGVHTCLPETVWNHEVPGKARPGWGRAWGTLAGKRRGRGGQSYPHEKALCTRTGGAGSKLWSQFAFAKILGRHLCFRNSLSWGTGHLLSALPGWYSFCFQKEKNNFLSAVPHSRQRLLFEECCQLQT